MHEVGASAGLQLRADHFRYDFDGKSWGPARSPVRIADAWQGALPPLTVHPRIVERRGADLDPIDPATEDGRLRLMSYVWPDQTTRIGRLRSALALGAC